ncbi:hypothetical protein [Desulfosporosinus hippei]|uniref:Uncharacterized protein n=1 Tax=Desulfosporosinus hippei DSM 8344 TaxID=1121419 RepID=A0A1G8LP25_9FIRM|nr:hypothetical protein [Desulfosporosinus hippei]SDI57448.1 hypothetical protein SAMN05443529_1527 [Desulfosporosinus hippei DSM 8344]
MYFITALTGLDESSNTRCFGYYPTREEALLAVLENRCDLNEGIYNNIVVERIDKGIHSITEEETWFQWLQTGKYLGEGNWHQISKPPETDHITNYAIG